MASTSTSTSTSLGNDDYVFDVFLNHRGPDVKKTLATALYRSLCKHDLRVFLDQRELKEGEIITPQIESAIRTASVHIEIFSPGYAHSKWCLDELVLMVDHMAESKSTIIPVFYGVDPADLRWTEGGNGVYGRALCELEQKKTSDGQPRHDSNTIKKWRDSLSKVPDLKGFDRKTYNGVKTGVLQCFEAVFKLCNLPLVFSAKELIEDVVEAALKNVKRMMHVAEYPKGLQQKLRHFESKVPLDKESEKAQVIGIVGLGAVGKTTLATEFFNRHRSNYKRSCFLSDIKDNSLTTLQSDLLKHFVQSNEAINSTRDGKGKLRKYLSSAHALVILDDVDNSEQLEALLLPARDVLQKGCLILVTSRNKDLLTSSAIPEPAIYELTVLDPQHSRELFCSHAFGLTPPPVAFDEVVEKFVGACNGLPLSLKVLGVLLQGKNDLKYWEAQLCKINKKLPDDIQSRLKLSYDSLDEDEKHMFLDVACFFIGQEGDTVIRIWDGCFGQGWLGLRNLQNRYLVEVDEQDRVKMHDHLRDLGRYVAEKEPPGCELRLWRPTDNLLDRLSSQSHVRGIDMFQKNEPEQLFETPAELDDTYLLNHFKRLRLLRADGFFVERLFKVVGLPQLIYLHWKNCPNSSLPSSTLKNLRVLYVEGRSLTTLWPHDSQAPLQLRELYIDAPLLDVPRSIGKLQHLEKIRLWNCDFETLPNEFCDMHSLKEVNLLDCSKMTSLPNSIGNLRCLQGLSVATCYALQTLPDSVGRLTGLQKLDLVECSALQTLPDSVGRLTGLQALDLSSCSALQTLPDSVGKLTGLQTLDLRGCSALQTLPDSVGRLTGLQTLDLSRCRALQTLPDSVGSLTGLQTLDLWRCSALQTLPDSVGRLTGLQTLDLWRCSALQTLPDSVGRLTGLQELDLTECSALQTLPDSVGSLTGLQTLCLRGCYALQTLPISLENLTVLRILG